MGVLFYARIGYDNLHLSNQFRGRKFVSQALIITGRDSTELIERERYWQQAVAIYPGFAAYRRRTDRQIPVMSSPPATPQLCQTKRTPSS